MRRRDLGEEPDDGLTPGDGAGGEHDPFGEPVPAGHVLEVTAGRVTLDLHHDPMPIDHDRLRAAAVVEEPERPPTPGRWHLVEEPPVHLTVDVVLRCERDGVHTHVLRAPQPGPADIGESAGDEQAGDRAARPARRGPERPQRAEQVRARLPELDRHGVSFVQRISSTGTRCSSSGKRIAVVIRRRVG